MTIVSLVFLFYVGSSLVNTTKKYKEQAIEIACINKMGPALGAARLAQIAANPEKSLIELLPQLPLEQSHLPDAQRYAAYQPRRETFRRLYQQLLPLMA